MKTTTMKQPLKLAIWFLATALFAMPLTLVAQTADENIEDGSDSGIATDVAAEIVEHTVELPTSFKSAVTMGLEKATGTPFSMDSAIEAAGRAAGISEAATSAAAGFLSVTLNSSSIATDDEEGSPYQMKERARQAQEAAAAKQFYEQNIKSQFEQHLSESLRNPKRVPTGPQIESCGVGACK